MHLYSLHNVNDRWAKDNNDSPVAPACIGSDRSARQILLMWKERATIMYHAETEGRNDSDDVPRW